MLSFQLSLLLACVAGLSSAAAGPQRIILVLVDGVRWDYISRDKELKGFRRIAENGAMAEYVTPIYPSNSYPNWYTIVTGLYAENHGMVQNYMYDVQRQDYFLMTPYPNSTHEHWWNQSEPLWVTAEKGGLRTAMHWWDGCQVSIHGVKPTVCHEYQNFWVWGNVRKDTEEHLTSLLEWFGENDKNRLAMLYYEGVDATGHFQGPDSEATLQAMRDIDGILYDFQNQLDNSSMKDEVNLVVVSDHGMTNSNPQEVQVIKLDSFPNVTENIELMLDRGSLAMILPVEGKEEKLYQILKRLNIKGMRVYRRHEIPEKYHFRGNDLVLPILLVADEGFFIQKIRDLNKMKPSYSRIFKGYHGYDPYKSQSQMNTILYARGPAFRKGSVSAPLQMTDHYNVFCHILGLEPLPNNGSWARVQNLLSEGGHHHAQGSRGSSPTSAFLSTTLLLTATIAVIIATLI